jgi:hypothetical protein
LVFAPAGSNATPVWVRLEILFPKARPDDEKAAFKAVVDAVEADPDGFDLLVRDKHRQDVIEYLCKRGNITADTPNETIAFVHDMEKVLLVKLWEATIPNEAWGKTLVRAQSLITAYHRFGIRLPMLMEFAACIIAKNFPTIESALPAARMELSLALQEVALRVQAQTATPNVGAQEMPGTAPAQVTAEPEAQAAAHARAERAKQLDVRNAKLVSAWETVMKRNPAPSRTEAACRVAEKHLGDRKKYRTVKKAVGDAGKWKDDKSTELP